ncbi:MAG: BrnT family toxin [Anaerolineales bacterium]|nr:BrnT family toxin [Anaerolineales bacterium]
MEELANCTGFEWDEYNSEKIWTKHQVRSIECEQVFFNRPFVISEDVEHSIEEQRYYALGQTDQGRRLFIAFTIRGENIHVITARDMSRKERRIYQDVKEEADTEV